MTTTTAPKRGPYASTGKRRKTIIDAVVALVDELGHEGVTTALVSQRSGVSETTVLYHFPSKDHLLVAALNAIEDQEAAESDIDLDDTVIDSRAFRYLPSPNSSDPRFRLMSALKSAAASPEHPAAEYFSARNARILVVFTRLIEHSQSKGLAHPGGNPRIIALQVIGVWEGLSQLWLSDPDFDLGAAVSDAIRRLTGQNLMEIQNLLSTSFDGPA